MRVSCVVLGLMAVLGLSLAQSDQACYDKYGMISCSSCWNPPMLCYGCSAGYVTKRDKSGCIGCASNCYECRLDSNDVDTTCIECLYGFTFGFGAASTDCVSCGDFCWECEYDAVGVQSCTECFSGGYVLSNLNNANCLSCGSNCLSCSAGSDDSITCSQCAERYYVKDGSCSGCPNFCLACSEDGTGSKVCSSCASGYQLNDDASACLPCQTACSTCVAGAATGLTSVAKCTACKDGFYLQDDLCISCFTDCAICDSGTVCTTCDVGFYPNGATATSCEPCDWKCSSCTSDTDCSACETGYALKLATDVVCDPCPANCDTCTINGAVNGACSNCADGYYKTSGNKCTKCASNCDLCSDFSGDCTSCSTGFVEADDGVCYPQVANCDPTLINNEYNTTVGKAYCTQCKANYALKEDMTQCFECNTGCADKCWYNSTVGNSECICGDNTAVTDSSERGGCTSGTVCKEGYYYDLQGTNTNSLPNCVECPTDGCSECNSTTTECISCKTGYYTTPLADGSCYKCSTGCSSCTYNEVTGDETCPGCTAGYYPSSGDCLKCNSLCASCSSDTTCTTFSCPSSCSACGLNANGDGLVCSGCVSGYALNPVDETCTACPDKCNSCEYNTNNVLVCSSNTNCKDGYGIKLDGLCYPCPANCKDCTADVNDVLVCDNCYDKYIENKQFCSPCSANCATCDQENGNVIGTAANDRYFLTAEKTCSGCPSSCVRCTASACSECDGGYGLSTDKKTCVVCSTLTKVDNCLLCDDAQSDGNATCTACAAGYILADDNSYCNLTSLLGANCDAIEDHEPECEVCDSSESFTLDFDDDEDDYTYPKRCSLECYTCGTGIFNPDGSVTLNGDPSTCNDKKALNLTETTVCKDGACGVLIEFDTDGKTMLNVVRGCSSNVTELKHVMEAQRAATKKRDQEKERSACIRYESGKRQFCGSVCYEDPLCNAFYYSAAGSVYASVMVVLGALVYSLSLKL